jgi:geranylgeranyl diphosphate synthase, type II
MDFIKEELKRLELEKKIKDILFINNARAHSVEWGMNYITFSPSKRLRPLLVLESDLIFSKPDRDSYILASAVELVHTYSLVHDDLPCMDNDDMRRGLKTLHKIMNEGYAVLVGDALLTKAFGLLSKYSKKDRLSDIIGLFEKKAGTAGMIYGQILDLNAQGKKLDKSKINRINELKTGALLELSLMAGAINGGADEKAVIKIEKFGTVLGRMFQLQDDILDITGDDNKLGKKTGSDEKNMKSSIPLILGIAKARKILMEQKKEALKFIKDFPSNKEFFKKLLDFFIERTN